ncbi:MAG: biotin synthase BioB [Acidobacteria bacterium]|nr:biotin synthase BioB [Acidobacteriota bacterium]
MGLRYDWTLEEVMEIYDRPLLALVEEARAVHRRYHGLDEMQQCSLLSIKTGGCPEDCAYCPQSAHYETDVEAAGLMDVAEVEAAAQRAREAGAARFCMGAAWRQVHDGHDFDQVLEMVRRVARLGMEVCCTLGMLSQEQAFRLAQAGLTAYNHNLDTSPEFYPNIITTRTYQDRLQTLERVRRAGITVCCGGIIGMGETKRDRAGLLQQLAALDPHPESVPINVLVRVAGTPLSGQQAPPAFELVRAVATARILMPRSKVRLSAGRRSLSAEAQALCFLAGANSIFIGEKLLTTPNPEIEEDQQLLSQLGLKPEALPKPPAPALPVEARLAAELDHLRRKNLHRTLRSPRGYDLSSNDYLGLSQHPGVRSALRRALDDGIPLGSTGSRLLRGDHEQVQALEERLARFKGSESALVFNSGYDANTGILSTLVCGDAVVFSDRLNHASIVDGIRASGAEKVLFPHLDLDYLKAQLERRARWKGEKFIVVESVYSMDGDLAPLRELASLCQQFGAHLIVDEAHATGIFGPRGAGLLEEWALTAFPLVTVHTSGKALGSFGAFASCSRIVRDYLVNRCRSFIFTTALPPLVAVQTAAALRVIETEPWRRQRVLDLAARLRTRLREACISTGRSQSQIIPVILGSAEKAVAVAESLQRAGFDVRAIRPPTVPEGTARLRVTVNAGLEDSVLDDFGDLLVETVRRLAPEACSSSP